MMPKSWIPKPLLLAVIASLAFAQTAPAQIAPAQTAPAQQPRPKSELEQQEIATESDVAFSGRVSKLREIGEWEQMRAIGVARSEAHPNEAVGWYAQQLGALMNGDVDGALAAGETAIKKGGSPGVADWLELAHAVRRNYPGRNFEPLQFVDSDVTLLRARQQSRAAELLKAKDYDEIERIAADLQGSKRADATGAPLLDAFFDGLLSRPSDKPEDTKVLQTALEQWRAARPDSNLARFAEIELSYLRAADARGSGVADTITPAMSARMNEELARGARVIAELPASAMSSPLMFRVSQDWGLLSGEGRAFLDPIYREGAARFPNYLPLFTGRLIVLLPRWYGREGEVLELLDEHADRIGGGAGDIVYAQGYIAIEKNAIQNYPAEVPYNRDRLWRGFEALRVRNPQSVSLHTTRVEFGRYDGRGDKNMTRAKRALAEKDGQIMDKSWYDTLKGQAEFAEIRMAILGREKR